MASGHEYRANRPNTWLLRPMLQSEGSSCQPGANGMDPALVFGAPCQHSLPAGQEHGRTIPLTDIRHRGRISLCSLSAWFKALRPNRRSSARSGEELKESLGGCRLLGVGCGCARECNACAEFGRHRYKLNARHLPNFT